MCRSVLCKSIVMFMCVGISHGLSDEANVLHLL